MMKWFWSFSKACRRSCDEAAKIREIEVKAFDSAITNSISTSLRNMNSASKSLNAANLTTGSNCNQVELIMVCV